MKRFIITVLISALLLQNVSAPVPLQASEVTEETTTENTLTENSSVISWELQEAFLAEAESYRVMIWLEDIDYDKVEAMAEKATATTWEEIESYEKQVYSDAVTEVARAEMEDADVMTAATLRTEEEIMADSYAEVLAVADEELKLVAEEVDSFIMAKRAASTALYTENNKAIASNSLIKENIEFVSRYSPMIIAELSREQIDVIAQEEGVVGIYLSEEEETSENTDIGISVCGSNVYTPDDEEYDYYLRYIDADKAHIAGLSGDGVKVGLLDDKNVYFTDHDELSDSSIYQVGPGATTGLHGIYMARIICGSYGMAPDCELYSARVGSDEYTYSSIEMLVDEGVSVINMSYGINNNGANVYGAVEMWFDHIAAQHNITFVKSSGNETGNTPISKPGLAYNVITVGCVNPITDCFDINSCFIDDNVVQKPDIVVPGTVVLDNDNGGTSAATAIVTGMIALMLEAKPTLSASPHILKAIVIASADHVAESAKYASGYDELQGAGVVNMIRALSILSTEQYYGNYTRNDSTISYQRNITSGHTIYTFVLVGTKMNIATGEHASSEYNNQNMPEIGLSISTTGGTIVGSCDMINSSVELVRCGYYSTVNIAITVSNNGTRGMPYALAWY